MSDKLSELRCTEFVEKLSSAAPVPGGGGAAALAGACGAALCAMSGNLTAGRKKYAAAEEDVRRVLEEAEAVQRQLLELIDRDAEAFEPLSRAYSIPKDAPGRAETLEEATVRACRAPLEIMRGCGRSIALLEEMLEKGNPMLASDVGCGALCCAAALEAASLNVFVNTKILRNRETAAGLDAEADALLAQFLPRARRIADSTAERLRGGK